uniref:Secreted protein n=1 Tax=Plectus sambesii TaxID=2011161 RepID=A0A914VA24_9BILA
MANSMIWSFVLLVFARSLAASARGTCSDPEELAAFVITLRSQCEEYAPETENLELQRQWVAFNCCLKQYSRSEAPCTKNQIQKLFCYPPMNTLLKY